MVYGTYNELVTGAYKPPYNWGASRCSFCHIGVFTCFHNDSCSRMENAEGVSTTLMASCGSGSKRVFILAYVSQAELPSKIGPVQRSKWIASMSTEKNR